MEAFLRELIGTGIMVGIETVLGGSSNGDVVSVSNGVVVTSDMRAVNICQIVNVRTKGGSDFSGITLPPGNPADFTGCSGMCAEALYDLLLPFFTSGTPVRDIYDTKSEGVSYVTQLVPGLVMVSNRAGTPGNTVISLCYIQYLSPPAPGVSLC
jgi:hypothetical protein